MKWKEMKIKHPDQFILMGDIVEEKVSESKTCYREAIIGNRRGEEFLSIC